jgi:hypothetical protein
MAKSSLPDFLKAYRSLADQGARTYVERMFLLVDTRPMVILWRTGQYTSWERLLVGEQLCPVKVYEQFEVATRVLSRKEIEHIGVDAAIVLSRVEDVFRKPLRKMINAYIENYQIVPARYRTWSFVKSLRTEFLLVPQKPTTFGRSLRH